MRNKLAIVFLSILFFSSCTNKMLNRNDDAEVNEEKYQAITSLSQLDHSILKLFKDAPGGNGIAEINGEYNPGCVIVDNTPRRKLVRAEKIRNLTIIQYKKGGIGVAEYRLAIKIEQGNIVSWQFLDPEMPWYSWELSTIVPEDPVCDVNAKFQYPEPYALGFCKK